MLTPLNRIYRTLNELRNMSNIIYIRGYCVHWEYRIIVKKKKEIKQNENFALLIRLIILLINIKEERKKWIFLIFYSKCFFLCWTFFNGFSKERRKRSAATLKWQKTYIEILSFALMLRAELYACLLLWKILSEQKRVVSFAVSRALAMRRYARRFTVGISMPLGAHLHRENTARAQSTRTYTCTILNNA